VVQALEREVQDAEWSAEFFERLANTDSETKTRQSQHLTYDIRW